MLLSFPILYRLLIGGFLLLLLFGSVVFAAPPSSPYQAGETLSPSCDPGDTNCTVASTTPAGSDTEVQFNDGGVFGADSTFLFNKTDDRLTVTNASTTNITGSYASSTNLFAGSFTLGSITGFLKATAGAVANALIDLANDVTGFLGVANGGTGTSTAFTAGSVVFATSSGTYSQNNSNLFWDDTNGRLGIGTNNPSDQLEVVGTIGATHLKGLGSAPSGSVSAGAGTGASISVDGTDTAGKITLNTGTLPAVSSLILSINFTTSYDSAPYVTFVPANAVTALLSGASMVVLSSATGNFTFTSGTVALTASTEYVWHYIVIE